MAFHLSRFYIRRVITHGKWYIGLGLAIPLGFLLAEYVGDPFTSNLNSVFAAYPMIMPITGLWGIIPLVTFLSGDRRSGFYEHLFATTGLTVEKVYYSLSAVSVFITSIPVVILLAVSFGVSAFTSALPAGYVLTLMVYSIPVSYMAPLLVLIVASTWSFTTKTIRGPLSSSPAGIVPILGLMITFVPVFIQDHLGAFSVMEFLEIYSASTLLLLLSLGILSVRLLKPERFLP